MLLFFTGSLSLVMSFTSVSLSEFFSSVPRVSAMTDTKVERRNYVLEFSYYSKAYFSKSLVKVRVRLDTVYFAKN